MMLKKRLLFIITTLALIFVAVLGFEMVNFNPGGYYWKCLDSNHVSHKHYFSDTAVTKANAHFSQYGHKVTVFKPE